MAKLMVSVVDEAEALEAFKGGADIIDVKNPSEGALGAQKPQLILKVRRALPRKVEVSATLGDLPYLPGTSSLAAVGAASMGVNYVKVGLFGVKTLEEAVHMVKAIREALKALGFKTMLVACGYADSREYGSLNPSMLPLVAYKAEADGILVDVKRKERGINLFSYLNREALAKLVAEGRNLGLFTAMAGGLNLEGLARCAELGADVVGVRRALLAENGRINRSLVAKAVKLAHQTL
ncbi:MAG: (5-formylfuran-3-yl)methyl phosphate synthase [Candidatus Hecatellaceae archaeon]